MPPLHLHPLRLRLPPPQPRLLQAEPDNPVRKYIIAGLLVWLPLAITIWVLTWVLGLLNSVFQTLLDAATAVLPASAHTVLEMLSSIPGLGVLTLLTMMMLTGMFVANFVGQWWLKQWHRLMSNIPIVKSIYTSVKQVSGPSPLSPASPPVKWPSAWARRRTPSSSACTCRRRRIPRPASS
jgi:Protein of unknown function (DUF502)